MMISYYDSLRMWLRRIEKGPMARLAYATKAIDYIARESRWFDIKDEEWLKDRIHERG